MGHEAGTVELIDDRIAPPNITIADQLPHAAGLAWGAAYRGDDAVVVCHFGDGATSEGDFHEAVNVAGVFDLPVVFVCNNNQYAISVPRARQTASDTLAAKAEAYGVRGVRVDGTDPLACHRAVETAVERARSGGRDGGAGRSPPAPGVDPGGDPTRPTLIEAVCYRFGPHTTADDPGTYRTDEEVDAWRAYDPLPRYEAYLRDRGLVDDDVVAAVGEAVDDRVAALIDRAEGFEPEPPSMFDHAFATTPPAVARQRAAFERLRGTRGDDAFRRE
jgi:pyruvate dehydrogenase E1 component alpha subunit